VPAPVGRFYVSPTISGTGLTGREVADRLLYEAGVAAMAGTAFGSQGVNNIRFSYANSRENITERCGGRASSWRRSWPGPGPPDDREDDRRGRAPLRRRGARLCPLTRSSRTSSTSCST